MTHVARTNWRYTPALLRANPERLFLFGDNALRVGKGGQAIIRDEPNALGIATKRGPGEFMESGSVSDFLIVLNDCYRVERMIGHGRNIIIPVLDNGDISIGCGLAELPERCPDIYAFLNAWAAKL